MQASTATPAPTAIPTPTDSSVPTDTIAVILRWTDNWDKCPSCKKPAIAHKGFKVHCGPSCRIYTARCNVPREKYNANPTLRAIAEHAPWLHPYVVKEYGRICIPKGVNEYEDCPGCGHTWTSHQDRAFNDGDVNWGDMWILQCPDSDEKK